jgi:hypothetical protein
MIERAKEIEKSIIDDTVNGSWNGMDAFISFISYNNLSNEECEALNEMVKQALQAPFSDRHKPLNALVCRAVEWQSERLAQLEQE